MKPYYEYGGITLYHGDCLEILPNIDSANAVVTDPPYSLVLSSNHKTQGWGDMMNSAFLYAELLRQFYRITAHQQGCAWMFNTWRSFSVLNKASFDAQWPIESLLVWDKEWIGPGGSKGLRPSYELVALFAHKEFALPNRSLPDIWRCQVGSHKPNGHPAEKPINLLSRIIGESPGQLVLDPFCGSGTTLVAAKHLRRDAIGIEIEERYCEITAQRLQQEVIPLVV